MAVAVAVAEAVAEAVAAVAGLAVVAIVAVGAVVVAAATAASVLGFFQKPQNPKPWRTGAYFGFQRGVQRHSDIHREEIHPSPGIDAPARRTWRGVNNLRLA